MLRIENSGKNSSIVESLGMIYIRIKLCRMCNVSSSGLEGLGRNTLMIRYGAWGMSSYLMEMVLSECAWNIKYAWRYESGVWGGASGALEKRICQVDTMMFFFYVEMTFHVCYGNS